ncbi:MAG: hypothetical protein AUJ49_05565 [Desulfovibrionaceae bacterium CG1_02_65_16]|nr:MAG: hypothetical protein AUJ49_05565 [Desulfovibrionaceae bacterium CG1_02_65_16]
MTTTKLLPSALLPARFAALLLAATLLANTPAWALEPPEPSATLQKMATLTAPATATPDRDEAAQCREAAPQPARTVLVKAMGQGGTPQEAEAAAIKHARRLAARHLERLGGALALFPAGEGQRLVSVRHYPVMGMAQPRTLVLLELRLRGQAEPLPPATGLPDLTASVEPVASGRAGDHGGVLRLSASKACEAVAALDNGPGRDPDLLPGGVSVFRLTPGKTVEHPLPARARALRVLACTGGLSIPADPATVDETFNRARMGRAHPSLIQGVTSDCVELRMALPAKTPARK